MPGRIRPEVHQQLYPWKWTHCVECGAMIRVGRAITCSQKCRALHTRKMEREWSRKNYQQRKEKNHD